MPQRKPVSACSWLGCLHRTHMRTISSILTQQDESFLAVITSRQIPAECGTAKDHEGFSRGQCWKVVLVAGSRRRRLPLRADTPPKVDGCSSPCRDGICISANSYWNARNQFGLWKNKAKGTKKHPPLSTR